MLIDIYRQSYFNRQFELKVVEAHQKGLIKSPIYLSIGTEHIPAAIADVSRDWLVFPQHRCHSWLLSFGADPTLVAKEILGRSDGLNGGMGGSASLAAPELGIYGHDGLLGSNAPIGVGMAHATRKPTIIHLGDAAVEEDYVLGCFGYAKTHKLDVVFIVEDNNLSILTRKTKRRNWSITNVCHGFEIPAKTLKCIKDNYNQVEQIQNAIQNKERGPLLLNIKCRRYYFHCGSGQDEQMPRRDNIHYLDCLLGKEWLFDLHYAVNVEIDKIWEPLLAS